MAMDMEFTMLLFRAWGIGFRVEHLQLKIKA